MHTIAARQLGPGAMMAGCRAVPIRACGAAPCDGRRRHAGEWQAMSPRAVGRAPDDARRPRQRCRWRLADGAADASRRPSAVRPATRPGTSRACRRAARGRRCHRDRAMRADGRASPGARPAVSSPDDEPVNERRSPSRALRALPTVRARSDRRPRARRPLPPSLVWELAYGELVFIPTARGRPRRRSSWAAIADLRPRNRRFGGLDS